MRKTNTILVLIIMLLFVDHVIFGSLHSLGTGASVIRPFAQIMLGLVLIHAIISLIVTVKAEKAGFKTGARYNKENREFWNRRVTGVLIILFGITHAYLMARNERGVPRIASAPRIFQLTTPLLIISIYFHILSNIRPLLISLGIRNIDKKEKIIRAVLTILLLFALISVSTRVFSHGGGH